MSLIPRLVVAYDFSEPARRAFELGVFMGRQLGAEVHVVTVLDADDSKNATDQGQELENLRKLLDMQTCGSVADESLEMQCHAAVGKPAEVVSGMARELDAPLIICGTTGKGAVARALLGSVSHELVHLSGAIVMSVP